MESTQATGILRFLEDERKALAVLLITPVLLYLRVLGFDFSPMDEQWLILKNEAFLSEWKSLAEVFTEPTNEIYYRPFLFGSYILDYHLGGMNAWMYHLTNLLLHIVNIVIMFKIALQSKLAVRTAFTVMLLFALHPVLLGSVAWIPGRADVILSLFFVLGLYFQNLFFNSGKWKFLLPHLLAFLCTLLSKETAVIFPLIYMINGWSRGQELRSLILRNGIPLGLITIAWYWVRRTIVAKEAIMEASFTEQFVNSCKALVAYAGKMILPYQQSVLPSIDNTSLIPGLVTLVLLALVFLKYGSTNKKYSVFYVSVVLFALVLPVWFSSASVLREQYENRMYVSMFGLAMLLGHVNWQISPKRGTHITGMFIALYVSLTLARMSDYKDQLTYLVQAAKDNPKNYIIQFRLADYYFLKKENAKAIDYYTNAIAIQPAKPMFYNNRANAYAALGNKEKALQDLDTAIVRSGYDPSVRLNKCMALVEFKEYQAAMNELNSLKQCCKDRIPPEVEQRVVASWQNDVFVKVSERIKQTPNNPVLYANRAKLYFDNGMFDEAIIDLEKAISLDAKNEEFKKYLEIVKSAKATK